MIDSREVVRLIRRCRFDLSNEKNLQEGLESVFIKNEIPFEREKRLSPFDIPDFLIDGRIVVECKVRNKSSKTSIYKQLKRYAEFPQVESLILASNVSMGLPAEIQGKSVFSASLSFGWL